MSYLDQIKGLKFKVSKVTIDGVDFYLRELSGKARLDFEDEQDLQLRVLKMMHASLCDENGTPKKLIRGSFVFRLAVRIARELHRPISEVLEYPTTEFNYWAVVFQEEYYEAHPKERYKSGMTESDCAREVEKFKRMMNKR